LAYGRSYFGLPLCPYELGKAWDIRLDDPNLLSHVHHFIDLPLELMEASGTVYRTLTSPVAAVLPLLPPDEPGPGSVKSELQDNTAWALSPLNPKNRVDTLESATYLSPLTQWHMTGCFVNGSQFYA
jgi:hypothetical protein